MHLQQNHIRKKEIYFWACVDLQNKDLSDFKQDQSSSASPPLMGYDKSIQVESQQNIISLYINWSKVGLWFFKQVCKVSKNSVKGFG